MLERIGYGPEVAAAFARWGAEDASAGRVTHVLPGAVSVVAEDGVHRASLGGCLLREVAADPATGPCAGDWVVLRRWPDRRETVEAVLPRRTAVVWPGAGQPLCANVDVAVLMVTGRPGPGDRALATRLAAAAPGVEVVLSVATDAERLRARLDGRLTAAAIGAPSHQKSALMRALVGAETLTPGEDGHGLVVLPGGGALIDVPALPVVDLGESGRGSLGLRP